MSGMFSCYLINGSVTSFGLVRWLGGALETRNLDLQN
jgi:hypothetical protein